MFLTSLIKINFGPKRHKNITICKTWGSSSDLQERIYDIDKNGHPDYWVVSTSPKGRNYFAYTVLDKNHDREIDSYWVSFGNVRFRYGIDLNSGENDAGIQTVTMPTIKEGEWRKAYTYRDLDLDGRFDEMLDETSGIRYIRVALSWVPTTTENLPQGTLWIEDNDGNRVKVIFQNGEWDAESH